MQTVLLVILIIVTVAMIGSILLQRSEGGALGIGGGGGGGFMSGRGTANALTRATAMLAAGFFVTCILLTLLARFDEHQGKSLIDTVGKPATTAPATPAPATAPATAPTPQPAATGAGNPVESSKNGLPDLAPILPLDPGSAPKQ